MSQTLFSRHSIRSLVDSPVFQEAAAEQPLLTDDHAVERIFSATIRGFIEWYDDTPTVYQHVEHARFSLVDDWNGKDLEQPCHLVAAIKRLRSQIPESDDTLRASLEETARILQEIKK